jgi:hypothetical protein
MLTKAEFSSIIKEEWALNFFEELRPSLGIASLVSTEYEGNITGWGDRVNVPTMISGQRAQIRTSDNEAYNIQNPVVTSQQLIVDREAVYATEITDWNRYVSQPNAQEEIRKLMVHEVARSVDEYVLSLFSSSQSQNGVSAIGKAQFAQAQRVQNLENVPMVGRKCLIDEYYLESLLQVNEILSRDYSPLSSAFMSGKLKDPIYGYEIYVSNFLPQKTAWFFHPSAVNLAIQKQSDYKEMDLEPVTRVPSMRARVSTLFGAKLFDNKRMFKVYNT